MNKVLTLKKNDKVEAAIKLINDIELEVSPHEEALARHRFRQGQVIRNFLEEDAAARYGSGIVEHIAQQTRLSSMTLYRARDFAACFDFDENKLNARIKEIHAAGGKPRMSYLSRKRSGYPNPAQSVEGNKILKEILVRDSERGGEAIELAKQEFGEDDEEIRGVEIGINQAIAGNGLILGDRRIYAPTDWIEYHNVKYEQFLLEQVCCITGASRVTLLHWAFKAQQGASDLLALPIDESLVEDFHTLGPVKFFERHNLRPLWTCLGYIQQFIAQETVPF